MPIRRYDLFAASLFVIGITCLRETPARAQTATAFSFRSGYDANASGNTETPTLYADGTSSETQVYQTFDNDVSGASTTTPFYQSPNSYNGTNLTNNATTSGLGSVHLAQAGFYVPMGESVTVSTLTIYAYVRGAARNPFQDGYFAIYNGNPISASSSIVAGDFTTNHLITTGANAPTVVGTRYPTSGSTDTSRSIYQLTFDLSSAATLTGGQTYFFAFSVDVDRTVSQNDAFDVIAAQNDATHGQPTGTGGGAVAYTPSTGWQTDQPEGSNTYEAYPFTIQGSVIAFPEPTPLALMPFGAVLALGATRRLRRGR